jgi:hypothetical protein
MGRSVEASIVLEVATLEHIRASVDAIEDVARAVSVTGDDPSARYLNVRFCHFQHDAFLNPLLHGFTLLPLHASRAKLRDIPGMEGISDSQLLEFTEGWAVAADIANLQAREAALILGPPAATPTQPLRLMVSANDAVSTQISTTLSNVATLLGRQNLVSAGAQNLHLPLLPDRAAAVDVAARSDVHDKTRASGWHSVAGQLREQSIAQGTPIRVSYQSPTFTVDEISARVPLMRHIYNTFPQVRVAVDRVVTLTARGLHVEGDVPEQLLQQAQDLMDRTSIRSFLAHLIRDTFVCGNGILSFGENPTTDVRLIPPESLLESRSPTEVKISIDGSEVWLERALHLRGSDQINSAIGISYLEPFLHHAMQRYMWLDTLIIARSWAISPTSSQIPEIQDHIRNMPPLALRGLQDVQTELNEALGTVTQDFPEPPADLYFPGQQLMQPSVKRVEISDGSPVW